MFQYLFLIIAALGLASALGTVLARNLLHAALYLAAFFFTIACLFVLLEAEFLAALQVLVYIGAVTIILIFGIMLTRNFQGDDGSMNSGPWKVPAIIAGLGLFCLLTAGIRQAALPAGQGPWASTTARPSLEEQPGELREVGLKRHAVNQMAKATGDELMTRFVVAFELAGLLLTAALVGAIAIAYQHGEEPTVSRTEEAAVPEPATIAD